eukprot:12412574-Karenia_brevis.AAC.1
MAELRTLAQNIGMDAPSSSAGPDPNQSIKEINQREKEARAKSAAGPDGGGEPPDDDDADSSDSD